MIQANHFKHKHKAANLDKHKTKFTALNRSLLWQMRITWSIWKSPSFQNLENRRFHHWYKRYTKITETWSNIQMQLTDLYRVNFFHQELTSRSDMQIDHVANTKFLSWLLKWQFSATTWVRSVGSKDERSQNRRHLK